MSASAFDAFACLVKLAPDGSARSLVRSPEAWRELNISPRARLMGVSRAEAAADLHPEKWEMHPEGDEVLHLAEGRLDAVLMLENHEETASLRAGDSLIVPMGVWHRLLLREPSTLVFITPAGGTRMKPFREGERP